MNPQGQLIGKATKRWQVGRLLGSGACGSVHELIPPTGSSSSKNSYPDYAIKIAPLPKSLANKSGKKRKKTDAERNADLILYECQTLRNVGPDMRGRLVPEIPFMGNPPACGETDDKSELF